MTTFIKINKQECIEKLQKEGLSNIKVRKLPPISENKEHDHPYYQVNIVISGELIISDRNGTKRYLPGDRVEVEAGTIHKATGGPKGGKIITAIMIKPPH